MAKPKQKSPETNVCGACDFCRVNPAEKEAYLCWVSPPVVITGEDGFGSNRGYPVELDWPKCMHYTPRLNS